MHTAHYTILSAATVETPASSTKPALTHLIGVGMLVAKRGQDGRWSFVLDAATAEASEADVIGWLSDRLPMPPATVIGWQIGDRLLPALLDAVAHAEAPLAHRFASACARTFTSPCIDPALDHGGVAAPPLDQVAREAGFPIDTLDEAKRFNAWAFSSLDGVRRQLEQEAIALWRIWLEQGCNHVDAIAATEAWLSGRD